MVKWTEIICQRNASQSLCCKGKGKGKGTGKGKGKGKGKVEVQPGAGHEDPERE